MNFSARFCAFALAIAIAGISASPVFAQTNAEVDAETIERAQNAFNDGAALYYEEEYSRALVEFRKANQAMEHPVFLFNIALCHRELGRTDRTLEAAQEARELFISFHERDEEIPFDLWARNDALIGSLSTITNAQNVAQAVADQQAQEESVAQAPDAEPVESGFGGLGWAGVGTMVVGAGALGGAAFIDNQVSSGIEELRSIEDEQAFNDERQALQGQQTTGQVLLFSGAGLATAGLAMVVIEILGGRGDSDDTNLAVSPSIQGPGLDVMVRW